MEHVPRIDDPDDAYRRLESLGASPRLLRHLELVGEAAAVLVAGIEAAGVELDRRLVLLGAACHDAGKIVHPEELDAPGSLHETAGEAFELLDRCFERIAEGGSRRLQRSVVRSGSCPSS